MPWSASILAAAADAIRHNAEAGRRKRLDAVIARVVDIYVKPSTVPL
jgi:hypothetical protein